MLHLRLGAGGYATIARGAAAPELIEQGWRAFLVRVVNPEGLTHPLS